MKYFVISLFAISAFFVGYITSEGADPEITQSCDVYFSEADNKHALVVDQTGNYVRKARSITINMTIGETEPTVKIESWDGPYRPTNTDLISRSTYRVRKVSSINITEFNTIINTGNKIRTGLEKPIATAGEDETKTEESAPIPATVKPTPTPKPVTKP